MEIKDIVKIKPDANLKVESIHSGEEWIKGCRGVITEEYCNRFFVVIPEHIVLKNKYDKNRHEYYGKFNYGYWFYEENLEKIK